MIRGLLWLLLALQATAEPRPHHNATSTLPHLAAWTFRANWSFSQPLEGAVVRPRISCPHDALSIVYTSSHLGTPPQSELLGPDQLTQPRTFPCVPDTETQPSPCHVQVVWHLACVLPCAHYCPSPTVFNASWEWVCHPQGFCQLQPRPMPLVLWSLDFSSASRTATPTLPLMTADWSPHTAALGSVAALSLVLILVLGLLWVAFVLVASLQTPTPLPAPTPPPVRRHRPVLLAGHRSKAGG